MRFFMIAAAVSVMAVGLSGCAMTGNGCGCSTGGCSSNMIASDCGCATGDCGGGCISTGAMAQGAAGKACGCGGVGCDTCSQYGNVSGLFTDGETSGGYGGGLTNTGMAMPLFGRGAACDDGSCGGGIGLGGGALRARLASRMGGMGCRSGDCEVIDEGIKSPGLIARIKDANAMALADQQGAYDEMQTGMCGQAGCGGAAGGCAGCLKGIAQYYRGNPYGGAVPHTNHPGATGGGAGSAPTYAYPYYTTRGPRDFLARKPMDIGY